MINKLVLENLKHRWVRTFLSALVVGVQVMSILTLIGLSRGLLNSSAARMKAGGADIVLKPDTQGTFSFSSGQLNSKFIDFVAKQPHVKQAIGILTANVVLVTVMNGIDFHTINQFNGGFRYMKGGPPQSPDDLIVDTDYATEHKLQVGQTVKLLNHNWHVQGIVENGVLAHLMVQLSALQKLTGNANPPRVSEIFVKLDDPALTDQMVAQFNELLKGNLKALPMQDVISQFSINNIPQLKVFILVLTILSVIVGFLVVFLSMYTAVVERTREIGILKALGAKPLTILDILVREAIVLALVGCVLGILLSYGVNALILAVAPASLPVVAVPDWWPRAAAIALAGALLGAIYPGLKAARQDAIEALSHE